MPDTQTVNVQTFLNEHRFSGFQWAIFWLCFLIIDKITPYDLWGEIVEKKNVALAIVVGSMCIAIGMIVAAAVHG